MNKPANPQGKGCVAVLDSLQQAKNLLPVVAKPIQQISSELFTSMFVLNSEIRFKPVPKQTYWLYCKNQRYQLSLIAPDQWQPAQYGRFIGATELQSDLTWTLQLADDCANDTVFMQSIAEQRAQLEARWQQAEKVEDVLPVYVQSLPYYARVMAAALAYSLNLSMHKSGIAGLNLQQAQLALTNNIPPSN